MGVYSVRARQNRKSGRVSVSFEVDPETWLNMKRSAESGAHPDTLDYVAGRLNMAFLEDFPLQESGPVKPAPDMDDDMPF